jgi:hypothetical protein
MKTLRGNKLMTKPNDTESLFSSIWRFLISIRPGKGYSAEFNDLRDPDKLKSAYEKYINKRFHRHQTGSIENGFHIVAEKGRWTRLGFADEMILLL